MELCARLTPPQSTLGPDHRLAELGLLTYKSELENMTYACPRNDQSAQVLLLVLL